MDMENSGLFQLEKECINGAKEGITFKSRKIVDDYEQDQVSKVFNFAA